MNKIIQRLTPRMRSRIKELVLTITWTDSKTLEIYSKKNGLKVQFDCRHISDGYVVQYPPQENKGRITLIGRNREENIIFLIERADQIFYDVK